MGKDQKKSSQRLKIKAGAAWGDLKVWVSARTEVRRVCGKSCDLEPQKEKRRISPPWSRGLGLKPGRLLTNVIEGFGIIADFVKCTLGAKRVIAISIGTSGTKKRQLVSRGRAEEETVVWHLAAKWVFKKGIARPRNWEGQRTASDRRENGGEPVTSS